MVTRHALLLCLALGTTAGAPAQDPEEVDPGQAEEAREGPGRTRRGERTGLIPLIDLGAGDYQGFAGGLYPGGSNAPPPELRAAAVAEGRRIGPLDAEGQPDPDGGLIGFAAIGLSTTAHTFGSFERSADADPERNPRLVLVNGGQAGNGAEFMVAKRAQYWSVLADKVRASGLSRRQVQVVWICQRRGPRAWRLAKEEDQDEPDGPAPGAAPAERRRGAEAAPEDPIDEPALKTFPEGPRQLQRQLASIVRNVRTHYPNVRLCYFSDRMPWPEPQSYETGFGIKWLIEQQLGGDPELNWNAELGPVEAPLLLWGPYLWADADRPNSLGTTWGLEDFEEGDAHPSEQGEAKVAALLSDFLKTDPSAAPWFLRGEEPGAVVLDATADVHTSPAEPELNLGAAEILEATGGKHPARVYLRFDLSRLERPVRHAKLSLRIATLRKTPFALEVARTSGDWTEGELTHANAPEPGDPLGALPVGTRDGTRSLDLTAVINALEGDELNLVLESAMPFDSPIHSRARESGHPPRLIVAP